LLLGGDSVTIDILVGEGCTLEIEDIGGTVAYDADDVESHWSVRIVIEAGGLLLWHGLPFVVASGANVSRRMDISLAVGARACIKETIVLGRATEAGGRARLRTEVNQSGSPLFVEELTVDGGTPTPGVIGDKRVIDSVLLVGTRAPSAERAHTLQLDGEGSLARVLERHAHDSVLEETWLRWSGDLREGQNR
jgi:urease accessory protein